MIYLLIIAGVVLRLAPHPDNVTPIMAIGLFAGSYIRKKGAFLIPLAALALSDIIIGLYHVPIMVAVYLSFAAGGAIGVWIRKHKSILLIAGGTLAGSILFFVISNFAMWAFGSFYPDNLSGLLQCYVNAIPFFRNSLLGNFAYVAILFGTYELVGYRIDRYVVNRWRSITVNRAW